MRFCAICFLPILLLFTAKFVEVMGDSSPTKAVFDKIRIRPPEYLIHYHYIIQSSICKMLVQTLYQN